MDTEILKGFIDEAESYLPMIRSGILLCSQDGKFHEELQTSLSKVHAIKGASLMVGLTDIGRIAGELEAELDTAVSVRKTPSDEQSRRMLDKVAHIEALLTELHFSAGTFSIDITDFVEESFENLQIGEKTVEKVTEKPVEKEEDVFEEEFEIDDEMREVFALEAEDLLRNITSHLAHLEKAPNHAEALLEIRRNAHTLKGSAGIVGLKNISQMAHRVEDLLDYLTENEIEGNKKIFELLSASTDCLNSLANNDISEQLEKKIAQVEKQFDELMDSFKGESKAESAVENKSPTETTFDSKEAVMVEQQPQNPASPNRSVIRVSLEKLDDLVRLVSEMVITRSVFEQRLSELGRQVEELQNSTYRLQRSTGKLEVDFEADTMAGARLHQPSFSLTPNLTSAGADNSAEFDLLELDRYTDFHQTTRELAETTNDAAAINNELDNLRNNLEMLFEYQRRLIEEMQDKLLRLRMVTFGTLTNRLHRTIRVTAEQEGKEVELVIEGEKLELDTQIIDSLIEPLLHLLRNAVAHGIESPEARRLIGKPETGKIALRIYSEGMHIVLSVADDGRGISGAALKEKAVQQGLITARAAEMMSDKQAFELIFAPGITTAGEINYVSGRGVGMNIVKTAIERQQGTISIASEAQKGTTFTLRLPMSLAVTRALLVKANEQIFAFPLKIVKKVTEISAEKLKQESSLRIDETDYALSHLNELLEMPMPVLQSNVPMLLIETLEKPCALTVEEILKAEEIVIKPLDSFLNNLPETVGAAILGDGSVVPVLDLIYLLKKRGREKDTKEKFEKQAAALDRRDPASRQILAMIVDDSPSVRHINSKLIKNAGMQTIVAKDGLEAMELLQTSPHLPDVILTDVEMPRMDGYELLASLKKTETLRDVPVVMITSRTSEKHRRKAFDLGVSEYMTKPYEDKKMIETIRSLSEHQRT